MIPVKEKPVALPGLPLSFPRSKKDLESLGKFDVYIRDAQSRLKESVTKNLNLAAKIATKELQSRVGLKHIVACIKHISKDSRAHKETSVYLVDSIMVHAAHYCDEDMRDRYERHLLPLVFGLFKRVMAEKHGRYKEALAAKFLKKIIPKWQEHGWFEEMVPAIKDLLLKKVPTDVKKQFADATPMFHGDDADFFDEAEDEELKAKADEAVRTMQRLNEKRLAGATAKLAPLTPVPDTHGYATPMTAGFATPVPAAPTPAGVRSAMALAPNTPGSGSTAPGTPATLNNAILKTIPRTPKAASILETIPRTPMGMTATTIPRTPMGMGKVIPGTPRVGIPGTPQFAGQQIPGTPMLGVPGTPRMAGMNVIPGTPRDALVSQARVIPATPREAFGGVAMPMTPAALRAPAKASPATPAAITQPFTPAPGAAQPFTPASGVSQPFTPAVSRPAQPFTPAPGSAPQPFTPAPGSAPQPFTPAPGKAPQPFTPAPGSGGSHGSQPFTPAPGSGSQPFTPAPGSGSATQPFTPAPGAASQPFTPAPGGASQPFTPALGGAPFTPGMPGSSSQPLTPALPAAGAQGPIDGPQPATPAMPPLAPGTPGRKRGRLPSTPTLPPAVPGTPTGVPLLPPALKAEEAPATGGRKRGRIPSTPKEATMSVTGLLGATAQGTAPMTPSNLLVSAPPAGASSEAPSGSSLTSVKRLPGALEEPPSAEIPPLVPTYGDLTPAAGGGDTPAPADGGGGDTPVPHTIPSIPSEPKTGSEPEPTLELATPRLAFGQETPLAQLQGDVTPVPKPEEALRPVKIQKIEHAKGEETPLAPTLDLPTN